MSKGPERILEAALYVDDLDAAEAFYGGVLDLPRIAKAEGRHVFFRCGDSVLLLFVASATGKPPGNPAMPVPPHGAEGPGHLCFAANSAEIVDWKYRLEAAGVTVEADFRWPSGGRSIYFRDPAGNSLEFAEPKIWSMS